VITLYDNDFSTCAQKVRLALAEKGLAWQRVEIDLRAGDQLRPEYLRLNPNGVVPTIEDGGEALIESNVILEYLDDAYPAPPLRPARAADRARMRLWMQALDTGRHAMIGALSITLAFRHDLLRKSPEALAEHLARIPDPARRARWQGAIERGLEFPLFREALAGWHKAVADIDAALVRGPWLAGLDYSLADTAYTPYLTRLAHLHLASLWATRPRVQDWFDRIRARPSYDAAMTTWLKPAKLEALDRAARGDAARVAALVAAL
jgi:glutathione S-transferase